MARDESAMCDMPVSAADHLFHQETLSVDTSVELEE